MQNRLVKNIVLSFFACLVFRNPAYSQAVDTIQLKPVTISESKINPLYGLKSYSVDSITMSSKVTASMSELLGTKTSVFIKSYGQGGLATASFRGTSASHTPVYWNDVAIHSPMLSQMDFSLIPVFFLDDINLFYGGSSLVNKSGGLGGSINLDNKKLTFIKNKVSLVQQIGSFSTYGTYADVNFENGNFTGRTRLMYLTSENDFSFLNNAVTNADYIRQTREDAGYYQYGILQELYFKRKNNDELSLKIWLQNNYREIPQPLTVKPVPNNESQKNNAIRSIINWKHYGTKSKIETSLAYNYDYLNYINKISFVNSDNTNQCFTANFKHYYEISPIISIKSGISGDYYFVNSNNYISKIDRKQLSVFTNLSSTFNKRIFMNLVLRKEITDNKFQPLLPSLSIEYKLLNSDNIYLKGNISRNYHLPSLNDLYWYPGGNPNLLPENGYSYEMGLKYRKLKDKLFDLEYEVTYFRTKITNWILWQPDPVFRYWTPLNLKEVISSGLEVNFNYTYYLNSLIFRFNTIHTLTSAKNMKPINQNDNTTDKQLIYTPLYSYNAGVRIEWKKIFINSETQYIGKRYTNTTNTRYMPSYQLVDVSSGLVLNTNKRQYVFQFSVCNIFDINYQAIAWQPMPGRNYELILKINFLR